MVQCIEVKDDIKKIKIYASKSKWSFPKVIFCGSDPVQTASVGRGTFTRRYIELRRAVPGADAHACGPLLMVARAS